MTRHLMRHLIPFALLASAAACSVVGGSGGAGEDVGPSYPQIGGPWMGALQIEGEGFNSMLEIEQLGPVLQLVIEIPALDLVTAGRGNIMPDGTFRASFTYELECPGEAELIGEASTDGEMVLSGTLLAGDCTGDLRGTFRYSR